MTDPSPNQSDLTVESPDFLLQLDEAAVLPPAQVSNVPTSFSLPKWFPLLFFFALGCIFYWKSLFTGDVFLPAELLGHLSPWKQTTLYPNLPPWNPLRWDGISQFYPWRKFASETIRSGRLPLWNPFQFGGTPFVANSQSAVFYPGTLLFILISNTARAFVWNALLHTTLCGWFTYLFLRKFKAPPRAVTENSAYASGGEGCSVIASLLGGVVFAFSSWQVAWLQLPTFLAASCWLPLVLRQLMPLLTPARDESKIDAFPSSKRGFARPLNIAALALSVGMMLLAGHLQIAFYGLITSLFFGIYLLIVPHKPDTLQRIKRVGFVLCGFALGFLIAMPQLLPSIELSRMSHRVGKPSMAGYAAYTELALPLQSLAMLTLPEAFGGDSDPNNPYWGFYEKRTLEGAIFGVRHNFAETAVYVGIIPLGLAALAAFRLRKSDKGDSRPIFFLFLGLFALALALGTPLNAIFYFGIPGFGQSGSPARVLMLWSFACACLSALGLNSLMRVRPTRKECLVVIGVVLFGLTIGLALLTRILSNFPIGMKSIPSLAEVLQRNWIGLIRLALMSAAGSAILIYISKIARVPDSSNPAQGMKSASYGLLIFVAIDLLWTGMPVNPTAKPEQVYPVTKGIAYLQAHTEHERISPINQSWSLYVSPPAVLPPNAGMVYRLRDLQGYDSLFFGKYKAFANTLARPNANGSLDASPPEVGNMVFIQNSNSPQFADTSAAFAVSVAYGDPGFATEALPPGVALETGDFGMSVFTEPKAAHRAEFIPSRATSEESISPQWLEDSPTRVSLALPVSASGKLILRDPFAPGWSCTVNGSPAVIEPSPDAFLYRAVSIKPSNTSQSRQIVTFNYNPASIRLGLFLALMAVGVVSGLIVFQKFEAQS